MDLSFGDYDCPITGYLGSDFAPPIGFGAFGGIDYFGALDSDVYSSTAKGLRLDESAHGQDLLGEKVPALEEISQYGFGETLSQGFDATAISDLESLFADTQPPPIVPTESATSRAESSGTSLSDFSFASFKIQNVISAPGSPDSGFVSLQSPQSSISDGEPSPCATPSPVMIAEPTNLPDLQVSPEDLKYLESLWHDNATAVSVASAPQSGAQALLTTVVLDSACQQTAKSSPTRKASGRPTKSLTASEKRERKRAQNKSAATRYREKRRAEAQVVYSEQSQMEEKNRGLKEKVTLLSKEIQYMRELLIEVYRAKGMVL